MYIDFTQNDNALVRKFQTIQSYALDTHLNMLVVPGLQIATKFLKWFVICDR